MTQSKVKELVAQIEQSISKGSIELGVSKPIVTQEIFTELFLGHLRAKCEESKYRLILYLVTKYGDSVKVMRSNLLLGRCYFDEAESTYTKYSFSSIEENYVALSRLPARAYLEYKQLDYEKSIKTTIEMIQIDEKLEDEDGFLVLLFHGIQQLHNLSRVYAIQNQLTVWCDVNYQIIKFLLTGRNECQYGNWQSSHMLELPPVLRTMMIIQVCQEFISISLKTNYHTAVSGLFGQLKSIIPIEGSGESFQYWLNYKKAFFEGDMNEVVKMIKKFLELVSEDFICQHKMLRLSLIQDLNDYNLTLETNITSISSN